MKDDLQRALAAFRDDFSAETGQPFKYFYCPILHTDDDVELCRGHVTNAALDSPDIWVPQVAAVDNFFGAHIEADMVAVIRDRGLDPFELILDLNKRRQHSPQIECDGESVEYYFPRKNHVPVPWHIHGSIVNADGSVVKDFVLKVPGDKRVDLENRKFSVLLNKDYRPQVIAAVIKAAHLTLFKMLGYRYVFSPTGAHLASILRDFYAKCKGKEKDEVQAIAAAHFLRLHSMCMPMVVTDQSFAGSVVDNTVLLLIGASQRPFAMCVLVRAADDLYGIFVGLDDSTVDTYLSFLNEPPVSVLTRFAKYFPGNATEGAHWEVYLKPERRIHMPHSGTIPQWAQDRYDWEAQARAKYEADND